MGIDAQIFAVVDGRYSDAEMKEINERFADAFDVENGSEIFQLVKRDTTYDRQDLLQDRFRVVLGGLRQDQELIEWYTLHRYYGPNYERGPALIPIGVAEWIERNFAVAHLFYGGDEFVHPFGKEEREEMWSHWARWGHRPYRRNR